MNIRTYLIISLFMHIAALIGLGVNNATKHSQFIKNSKNESRVSVKLNFERLKQKKKIIKSSKSTLQKVQKSEIEIENTNEVKKKQEDLVENEYLQILRELIEKNKFYPMIAKRLKQQGEVLIKIYINSQGIITDLNIIHSSQFKSLDFAALEILKKISPLKPPPSTELTPYEVTIPINFELI